MNTFSGSWAAVRERERERKGWGRFPGKPEREQRDKEHKSDLPESLPQTVEGRTEKEPFFFFLCLLREFASSCFFTFVPGRGRGPSPELVSADRD